MKTKLTWLFWLAVIGVVAWGFMRQHQTRLREEANPENSQTMGEIWDRRDATLAHQYDCPLLSDKFSTNDNLFTSEVESFFSDNKRVALRGYLVDVYQSESQLKTIFQFKFYDDAPEDTAIYAVLECPTNLASKLTSIQRFDTDPWGLVIEVDNVRLRSAENTDEDNKSSEVSELRRIEGKLLAVEPP
jgi:hypothetical protein